MIPKRRERIAKALEVAVQFGGIDGAHHKTWVIDQMVRALTGCNIDEASHPSSEYLVFVEEVKAGEDGPNTYEWDEGTPP